MSTSNHTRDEVRRVLVAAADVLFSDGAPEAFLDQWTDETLFMLSISESRHVTPRLTGRADASASFSSAGPSDDPLAGASR